MADVINAEKSIKYLRYVITTQKDRFIIEENKKVKKPLGFIRRGIYYLYTQEVKALLERKGFNYKQVKAYLQLNEMACFDKNGDFKLCSIDNKKVRMVKLTDNFFEDQEDEKMLL